MLCYKNLLVIDSEKLILIKKLLKRFAMRYVKICMGLSSLLFVGLVDAMDRPQAGYFFRGHKLPADGRNIIVERSMGKDLVNPAFVPGELVIIQDGLNPCKFATIVEQKLYNQYQVRPLKGSAQMILDNSSLAGLKPLWHCIYQPTVCLCMFQDTLATYIENINSEDLPFFQSRILEQNKKIIVLGDLHGSFSSLAYHLLDWFQQGIISENLELHSDYTLVCTGDYIDRGLDGIEVLYVLMNLKLLNRGSVFLIRGNHENGHLVEEFGFKHEWITKFGDSSFARFIWEGLSKLFESMPHAVILGRRFENLYDCLMFSHGGIEDVPDLIDSAIAVHAKDPEALIVTHPCKFGVDNNFNWMDFYAGELNSSQLMRASGRGGDKVAWSWALLSMYLRHCQTSLDESKPYRYCLRALFRGHQHLEGGISQLRHNAQDGKSWQCLENGLNYPVDMFGVYTFTSAPDGLPSEYKKHDSYGIISITDTGWILTPHIRERPSISLPTV